MNGIRDLSKVVVALAWMVLAPVSAWAGSGYIFDSSGSVSIATGKDAPRPAAVNDTVTSGMTIRTGSDSHAVLKFEDGEVISMQADSALLVREYNYVPLQVDQSNMVFSMLKGGMRFVTGFIGKLNPKGYRLATPVATVGILGTDFFAVLTNKGLYNQVLSGRISLTNAEGRSEFTSGNTSLTASSTSLPVSIPPDDVPAETFSQIAAIPVPPAEPGPIPLPVAIVTPESALSLAAVPAEQGISTGVVTQATAGGAATGGAGAATTTATAGTGISGTVIAIGLGVAAGAAALAATSSTTHH